MKKPIWTFVTLCIQFVEIFANCEVDKYTICNFEYVSQPMLYPIYTNSNVLFGYTEINFDKSFIPKLSNDSFSVKAGQVVKLAIRNSRVRDISKDAFAKFPSLMELNLDYNNLTIINQEFHTQGSLYELTLSHNSIRSIDAEAFKNNSRLQTLDLSFNKLSCLESPCNSLGKTVGRSWFSSLTSLEKLDVSSNKLSMLNRTTFSNNLNLKYLNLSNNFITGFKARVFQRLSKLIYLNLHSNSLSKLDVVFFVGLRSLQTLDLSFNRLLVLDTIGFHHTPLLENLRLHYNFLREVPVIKLAHYTNLESISIRENKIDCPAVAEIVYQLKLFDIKLDERSTEFQNRDGISCNVSFEESFETAPAPTEKYYSMYPASHPPNYYGIHPTPSYWDNYYTKPFVSRPEQNKWDYITRHGSLGRPARSRLISRYWDNYRTTSSESKSPSNFRDHYNKYTTSSWDYITRYYGSQRPPSQRPSSKYQKNSTAPSETKSSPNYQDHYHYTTPSTDYLASNYWKDLHKIPSTSRHEPNYWEILYTRPSETTTPSNKWKHSYTSTPVSFSLSHDSYTRSSVSQATPNNSYTRPISNNPSFWDMFGIKTFETQPSSNYHYNKYYSFTGRPSNNRGNTFETPATPTPKPSSNHWQNSYTSSPRTLPPPSGLYTRNYEAFASRKDFLADFENVFQNSTFYRMFSEYIENQQEKWDNLTDIVKELVVENEYHKKLEKMGVETSKGINLEVKLENETVNLVVLGKPSNLKDGKTQTIEKTHRLENLSNLKKRLVNLIKDNKAKISEEKQQSQNFNDLNNVLTDLMKDSKLKYSEENQENANNLQKNFRMILEGNKDKIEEQRKLDSLKNFLANFVKPDNARNFDSNSHNKPRDIYNSFNMIF